VELALKYREELNFTISSIGELAAFIAYAQAFPDNFLALVDTYDTLSSGVPNFICVALALNQIGHVASGIRLDSGDLAYLSKESRHMFMRVRSPVISSHSELQHATSTCRRMRSTALVSLSPKLWQATISMSEFCIP
jgi:hypothetical protein